MNIEELQSAVCHEQRDGWLFYNFHNIDPSANNILEMQVEKMLSRRWFYLVKAKGEPVKLVHKIESGALDHLPGLKVSYSSWKELHQKLREMLSPMQTVCMQYSPQNAIPYVSFVDAGTFELVSSCGVKIFSSANLVQRFEAIWDEQGRESHKKAICLVGEIVHEAFDYVRRNIQAQKSLSEYQVQQFILERFSKNNMICDHPPIVAVNEHSGDPHYEPLEKSCSLLKKGDFLLIDLWAKLDQAKAIYADITWVAVIDDHVEQKYADIFHIVRNARDAAVNLVKSRFQNGEDIFGYEVDDACREVIERAGYGQYFVHRTGHSIGEDVHWKGVNIDNFETKDERKLIDGLGFSIEPGIYLPEFGVRSELDMYIEEGNAHVSGDVAQTQIIPLLKS